MVIGPSRTGNNILTAATVKFLCSYSGKILPRYPDGKLRYLGGETRVLAVDRSISFADLLLKLRELCGANTFLRCQLPTEDLDSLVSITSDEDLTNLIEEYDRTSPPALSSLKIRAFLSLPKPNKHAVPPPQSPASLSSSPPRHSTIIPRVRTPVVWSARCLHQQTLKLGISKKKPGQWKVPLTYYHSCGSYCAVDSEAFLIHNRNHRQ